MGVGPRHAVEDVVSGFDPGAVPPADDPLGDPAAAELAARLEEARALIDARRPATEENKARFLEDDVLRAAALLRAHDPGYFVLLADKLRPLKILREWLKAVKTAGERMAGEAAVAAAKAKIAAANPKAILKAMNKRFAVVMIGGTARIVETDAFDPALERKYLRFMRKSDLDLLLMNETVPLETRKGEIIEVPKSLWWLGHPKRRTYSGGVVLDPTGRLGPNYLNTWRGFSVAPREGDPSVIVEHVSRLAAGNGPDAPEYLLNWLARKVQRPGDQAEVAVVMRGDEGHGKGMLGHAMVRIFGVHGMHISQSDHLVGKFNGHQMNICFLFPDEAFFAGDPRHFQVLKALITEALITIEQKFVELVPEPEPPRHPHGEQQGFRGPGRQGCAPFLLSGCAQHEPGRPGVFRAGVRRDPRSGAAGCLPQVLARARPVRLRRPEVPQDRDAQRPKGGVTRPP